MQHAAGVYAHPQHQQTAHLSGDFAGAGLPSMLLPPHQSPAAMPGPLHLPFKSASPPLGARPSHLSGGFAHSNAATNMDENRYRYHVYERESTWAEVEKLSGYISRYAVAEAASATDISKEKYYDLFNIGVHLLKAIETLDPDRLVLRTEQFAGSLSSPPQRPLGQAPTQAYGTASHQAMTSNASLPLTAGTSPPFPQPRSMSPHMHSSNPADSPNFPNRYMLEPGGGGLAKVPPTVPMGGIARYNQSIVSGMLSMGQPMAGQPPAVPFGKQPIEPELQPAAQQDNLMSAEAGDNPSGSGSGRKKRRRKVQRRDLHCHVCGVTDTPEWRRGPDGDHTLCNACGLHYAKALKKEKEAREKEGRKHSIDMLLNNQGRENARHGTDSKTTSNVGDTNSELS
ncbi:GATA zinc finger domain containing protein [Acanthamoeba castellanii str. Neff]|uniref:GATA zinc finger domain containing protein n=1 Tax=Acanthamoeba castellanii (strain ATCC 30010 / Neff) TaxID=1257118 RepID=L8GTZ2_ACACF|nr:GATA zinc finger domain containing protein [Acanthamoeba castellanii str. Neff]ELR16490.1 GATA zinc finger domain containing protein [Acanthamoeba castellanii str. Neff]